MCSFLVCLSKGMAASVWDFNVHADLLNLYAHRGFLNTGRESALKRKVDSGRETLAQLLHQRIEPTSVLSQALQSSALLTELSYPILSK